MDAANVLIQNFGDCKVYSSQACSYALSQDGYQCSDALVRLIFSFCSGIDEDKYATLIQRESNCYLSFKDGNTLSTVAAIYDNLAPMRNDVLLDTYRNVQPILKNAVFDALLSNALTANGVVLDVDDCCRALRLPLSNVLQFFDALKDYYVGYTAYSNSGKKIFMFHPICLGDVVGHFTINNLCVDHIEYKNIRQQEIQQCASRYTIQYYQSWKSVSNCLYGPYSVMPKHCH
jgi:hypothetical protein